MRSSGATLAAAILFGLVVGAGITTSAQEFEVDPEVTLDSVVKIGNGPQEISTDIKFYPNTRRAEPGETVYWTLDLGDLEGPFTIIPEIDNDGTREAAVLAEESPVVFAHTYNTPNLYIPYLRVTDGRGNRYEIDTRSVVGVIPELTQRLGIGVDLPSLDGEPGDYLKAMNVYAFDYKLFGTLAGERFIQQELDRVAGLGVNMMIYNIGWVFDQPSDFLHEPVYGDAGWLEACCSWVSTLPIEALIKLSDWCHERGMRVAIRYFLWRKCYESVGRETFTPSSAELYIEQQTAIQLLYAEVCEKLGIEAIFLNAENDVFTREPLVSGLISEVRAVYHGLLSGGAYSVDQIYGCPYAEELDFLAWSDYYFYTGGLPDDATVDQLKQAYLFHYLSDIRPVLAHFGKPGMALETGVNIYGTENSVVENQYTAYLEAFTRLQQTGAPLIGNGWWVWNLSDPPVEPHVMRGHSAERILANYFLTALSDQFSIEFPDQTSVQPSVDLVLQDFEHGMPSYLFSSQGSSVEPTIVGSSILGDSCLRLRFEPTDSPDYRHGFILEEHTPPLNWSRFTSFNFWLKSSNENWGMQVTLYDADGDSYIAKVQTKPYLAEYLPESGGWRLVSIPLALFTKPSWDTGGNGSMDWRRVKDWGIGIFYKDHGAQTLWVDGFYMSEEGALP